jgi:hypothetical protein
VEPGGGSDLLGLLDSGLFDSALLTGACKGEAPTCTVCGAEQPEVCVDGGAWVCPADTCVDAGCAGSPAQCTDDCGDLTYTACVSGSWQCPSPASCTAPQDAGGCVDTPPTCIGACGDTSAPTCVNGDWQCLGDASTCTDSSAPPPEDAGDGGCPDLSVVETGTGCGSYGLACYYPGVACICSKEVAVGVGTGPDWLCVTLPSGCPTDPPDLGTPCGDPSLTHCNYGECFGGKGRACVNGVWRDVSPGAYGCPD